MSDCLNGAVQRARLMNRWLARRLIDKSCSTWVLCVSSYLVADGTRIR